MGIPVVFFGDPSDYRTAIVRDIGGKIYSRKFHEFGFGGLTVGSVLDRVDWSPEPLNIDPVKERLVQAVGKRIEALSNA